MRLDTGVASKMEFSNNEKPSNLLFQRQGTTFLELEDQDTNLKSHIEIKGLDLFAQVDRCQSTFRAPRSRFLPLNLLSPI